MSKQGTAANTLFPIVALLFFSSGAFALVYQIAWVRALALEFGSTTLAVSTVVAVFMAGLGIGARIGGSFADASDSPLRKYGIIEISLGAYALISLHLIEAFTAVFRFVGTYAYDNLWTIFLLRAVLSSLVLLPPTILMGMTLPLLSRFVALQGAGISKGTGMLYGLNTIGAYVGCLLAGFTLLPSIGLYRSILYTAILNIGLGVIAIALAKRAGEKPGAMLANSSSSNARNWDPILLSVALSGAAALICEVAWTRVLILVIGGSVYAFVSVLAVFLAGLGIGGYVSAIFLDRVPYGERKAFFLLCFLTALAVFATTILFPKMPELFVLLLDEEAFARGSKMFAVHMLICSAVMAVPAILMGALFPLAIGIFETQRERAGFEVGRLYAYNTFGAIVGSLLCGFWALPELGMRGTMLLAIFLQCLAGSISLWQVSWRLRYVSLAATALCTGLFLMLAPTWQPQVMASGVFTYGSKYKNREDKSFKEYVETAEELLFYRDGLTATITVTRDRISATQDLYISTNGKIDGSSHYDMPTQRVTAHMPILLHPKPSEVCVLGMGTGVTAGSAGLHPVHVTLLEIEEEIVKGSRLFRDHNNRVHDNKRVDIRVTDGRLFLNLHPKRFDVIISEPSNPWLAGVAGLFTVDFYTIGANALREGGIFAQWGQIYNLSSKNVQTMIRSFAEVFPYTYIVVTIPNTDTLMLGSKTPITFSPNLLQERMRAAPVARDLADHRVRIRNVPELLARVWLGPEDVRQLIGTEGPLHTDDLPTIAYQAPKNLYISTRESNMRLLSRHARGVHPFIDLSSLDENEKREFLSALDRAYQAFVPEKYPRFFEQP